MGRGRVKPFSGGGDGACRQTGNMSAVSDSRVERPARKLGFKVFAPGIIIDRNAHIWLHNLMVAGRLNQSTRHGVLHTLRPIFC
jgi:hypothetical protein